MPPEEINFVRRNFMYRVPMNEDAEDYVNYILGLIKSIADVHELDKLHLRNQFNKDSDIEIEFFPG